MSKGCDIVFCWSSEKKYIYIYYRFTLHPISLKFRIQAFVKQAQESRKLIRIGRENPQGKFGVDKTRLVCWHAKTHWYIDLWNFNWGCR